jgi:hypothetical protein
MKEFKPVVTRVNKQFDKHNKITSVEYFYELTSAQRILLERILEIWNTILTRPQTAKKNGFVPHNYDELIKIIRLVLRTKEYSEKYQDSLKEIRLWYISYKNNK